MSLVSICIPTWNGEKFLKEALDSIRRQTYSEIEVIISDDNSLDRTLEIAQEFKNSFYRPVEIYLHEPNGIGANWNNCMSNARGEFIKFLFQDDLLYPTCIEEMVQAISYNRNIGLVASKRDFLIEGKINPTLREWVRRYEDLQKNLNLPQKNLNILQKKIFGHPEFFKDPQNKIAEPSAVLFRKSILAEIGYFREDLQQVLDCEFYYRLLKISKIGIINKKLVGFRIHPLQATNINRTRPIKDYKKFDEILYKDYFWLVNMNQKKRLFFSYNIIGRFIQRVKNAAKGKM